MWCETNLKFDTNIAFQDAGHGSETNVIPPQVSSSNQSEGSNCHPPNASRRQTADGVRNLFASNKTLVPITPDVLSQPRVTVFYSQKF